MDPLRTHPIQAGWKFSVELYPSWRYRFIDNQDPQFDNGSVWTRTQTWSDGSEPWLTLAAAPPHNNQGTFDADFRDYIPEDLIGQSDPSFDCLGSFVAATEGSMWFSTVLLFGGLAIANNSQAVPCSDIYSSTNDITCITNMTTIENMRWVDGSTILEGAMSLGGP
jgi:hypothetical protein